MCRYATHLYGCIVCVHVCQDVNMQLIHVGMRLQMDSVISVATVDQIFKTRMKKANITKEMERLTFKAQILISLNPIKHADDFYS